MTNTVIGYVGTSSLETMRETDIRCLDIINIAFAHVDHAQVVWKEKGAAKALERIRRIHPGIRILLSVGGWGADGFSQASMTEDGRKHMAQSAALLTEMYGLDGIDIDWEYPGSSLAGIGSDERDREHFTLLLKEMRRSLDQTGKRRMLTIAAGGDAYFTKLTNMGEAVLYLDYVQLMTYDLQGGFQRVTGHHAPLYHGRTNLSDACVDKAVRCFAEAGVPKNKMIVGIPFYSRLWKGVLNRRNGLGMEAETIGGYGPDYFSLKRDFIGQNGFRRHWDSEAKAPYLFDGSTFISYEDRESIREKIAYLKREGLGGMMFWEYKCDPSGELLDFIRTEMDW